MTTAISATCLTLAEWAKRRDPNGKVSKIVELLSQSNQILDDMQFEEGNLPTGTLITVRTGLPTVYWRMINQGTTPSKSRTAQIQEQTGILEAWSEVDEELCKLEGNIKAFRMSEAQPFIEAMNQEMAGTVFYGARSAAEEFVGFAPRYSAISGATNGQNVISAGGASSDNSSIWLIVWGANTCKGIFPKGSKAGLIHEDYGVETVEATAGIGGTRLRAYRERYQWKCGIALKDWRYAVRICNIDISNLIAQSNAADLVELMIKAIHRIPNISMGKPAFYCNRTIAEMLDIQRRRDVMSGGQLGYSEVDGKWVNNLRGIPIRTVDQLTEAEATVS